MDATTKKKIVQSAIIAIILLLSYASLTLASTDDANVTSLASGLLLTVTSSDNNNNNNSTCGSQQGDCPSSADQQEVSLRHAVLDLVPVSLLWKLRRAFCLVTSVTLEHIPLVLFAVPNDVLEYFVPWWLLVKVFYEHLSPDLALLIHGYLFHLPGLLKSTPVTWLICSAIQEEQEEMGVQGSNVTRF